jgi:serine phosphatase RsbU (regulator of sigma subunit)/pSer/pThr/pTyr-binding forkhead associated (FHA) protein
MNLAVWPVAAAANPWYKGIMPTLVILQGPDPGRQFSLGGGTSMIGRTPEAAVYLESLAVSRQHAQIVDQNDEYFVEDVGSSNGTFVNGQQVIGRIALTDHDTLQIGPYLMVLRPDTLPVRQSDPAIRVQVSALPSSHTLYAQNPTHKLQVVMEIAQHLARTLEVKPLLTKLLGQLLQLFPQADRGMVLLGDGDHFEVHMHERGKERDFGRTPPYSRTLVQRALAEGIGVLSEDVAGDEKISKTATLVALKLRSLLCAPLICQDGRRLGVIQLDCMRQGTAFTEDDLELVTAIALQVAVVLDNAALHAEKLREERFRQELKLAREIQQGFLPTNFATLGADRYELFARVYPAREVSGDLYDFFQLADGRLVFFLGDVSGKGMPAALFMIAVRTLGRHLASGGASPAETLGKLNEALSKDNPSAMFVTLLHGNYDPAKGEVVVAAGGHPPPLLRRGDGTVEETTLATGRLLGYPGENLGLADTRLTLTPGDTLILYTDGFTEARAPDGQTPFGSARLRQEFGGTRTKLPLEICAEHVRAAVEAFTGSVELQDDLTVLLLRQK